MNDELIRNTDEFYDKAEEKASDYYNTLYEQVIKKRFITSLTNDFKVWKKERVRNPLISFFLKRREKLKPEGFHNYIKWLDYNGELDSYLERSMSYIFMRDLGKSLDSDDTKEKIREVVDSLKDSLTKPTDTISISGLYRKAQKENMESTMIWIIDKLKKVSKNIPDEMDAEEAKRKLIKIIAGVLMHQIEQMEDHILPAERTKKIESAIRLGYSYGLTYPFIDDLLDAKILSKTEEERYSDIIRTTLITGEVPELGEWSGNNEEFIRFVHSELKEAFEYIKEYQPENVLKSFLNQCYVFFNSQEVDRVKKLTNNNYTNEDIYIPIILKSSSSRLISRSVISGLEDEGFDNRTFYYGIYNQLADDFADMFSDMNEGSVTPYTYYMKYHHTRLDLVNPFELYWTVISNLIHNVYNSDIKTCKLILDRAINGLKRFKDRVGIEQYNKVMNIFAISDVEFNKVIQTMVNKANGVEFFDKLLRDHIITTLKSQQKEQQDFSDTMEKVRTKVNSILSIQKDNKLQLFDDEITEAVNYSLEGDGKRIRPIMAWEIAVNQYGLSETSIEPLLKALEYLHTASLIIDDLPSQDNASTRRGRSTLHEVYNTAIAELSGIFLTQKAIEEEASLDEFNPKSVLKLIKYSAQMIDDICKGQAMDLNSKGKQMTLDQLNMMCFYKTGKAFEASLIMPAILAQAKDHEQEALKKYSYHGGIAFQIKDDLLDVEGDSTLIGKQVGKDNENNSSTFVSILGQEEAKKKMWEHYCLAMEALDQVSLKTSFLKHLLTYIVTREM